MGNIHDKLEDIFNSCGGRCVIDSAFACSNYPFLIKSEKPAVGMTLQEMNLAMEATSMHQSVEWGMQAFQASFPRVKD